MWRDLSNIYFLSITRLSQIDHKLAEIPVDEEKRKEIGRPQPIRIYQFSQYLAVHHRALIPVESWQALSYSRRIGYPPPYPHPLTVMEPSKEIFGNLPKSEIRQIGGACGALIYPF